VAGLLRKCVLALHRNRGDPSPRPFGLVPPCLRCSAPRTAPLNHESVHPWTTSSRDLLLRQDAAQMGPLCRGERTKEKQVTWMQRSATREQFSLPRIALRCIRATKVRLSARTNGFCNASSIEAFAEWAHSVARSIVALSPLPLRERPTRKARRERGWRRRRLLRRRHPLPNPSPVKG